MKEISNLRVGDGMDKDVNQGPLINKLAVEKIELLLDDAIKNGAKICLGGQRHELGGNFFQPTLLVDCSEKMRIWSEEIFGPILSIFSFQCEEEAIRMANNTEFGLASYLYSINIERCLRVSRNLEYGMIGINTSNITSPASPFSGVKNSGYGVHGSIYSLENYLTLKSVVINYGY
jgi:succinate-semialdehyde dehydrogenase/glutarate-semialdehyde dehydrogenase